MDEAIPGVRYLEFIARFPLNPARLPFYNINSCALGIACKTYLDELSTREDPTSESARAEMKEKGQGWVVNSDFAGSLEDAFKLWDAVSPLLNL